MFSAYVVVGRAAERARERRREAVGRQGPAHVGVEVGLGHLGHGLHVTGVLRDQRDHAGQHQQDEGQREARGVDDRDPVGRRWPCGKPIQSRTLTPPGPDQSTRWWSISWPLLLPVMEWMVPNSRSAEPREHVAEEQGEQDGDPRPEARQQHRRTHHERGGEQRDPLVLRPVDAGDDRREVEADQHHDGAGHGRRQDLVDDARAREVHEHPDDAERETGDEDRAGDVGRVAVVLRRGSRSRWRRTTRWCRDSWAPGSR